jgi:hypothetical protein
MKTILLLISIIISSNFYAQNLNDFFYQPTNTTVLDQVFQSNRGFVTVAEFTISNRFESFQGKQFLISDQIIEQIGTHGSNYFIRNFYLFENNSVILYADSRIAGGANYEKLIKTPIFKIPSVGKELAWENSFGRVIAKFVNLPTKSNSSISAVRIEKYYEQGEITEIEFWCKGWGLSLVLDKSGSIVMVNRALFDLTKLNSSAEILNYSNKDEIKNNYEFELEDLSIKIEDESLLEFITNLKSVVRERDTVKIKDFLGGYLKYLYKLNPLYSDNLNEHYAKGFHNNKSEIWAELEKYLNVGCYKIHDDEMNSDIFIFPWYEAGLQKFLGKWDSENDMKINSMVEVHDAYIVLGENVNVRSKPTTSSDVVAKLSKAIVKRDDDYREPIDNNIWVNIETLDNKISGFISANLLYTPQSIRIVIGKDYLIYKYDGKYFSTSSELSYYLYNNNIENVNNIIESDKYKLKGGDIKDNGWKILHIRTWD